MDSQRDARAALEEYLLHGWREVGRELGRGSYAAVVEVDYKGLRCAAKKIYHVLYEQGIGNLVSRFEQECRLLSQLRHPHVVQFLGIYFDPDSNLPVLVMELLPTTLAQCLDTYGVLPEEINYGILRDVALGLRYLHERPQPIVHRDLSANNVLLTSDMRGKISDLGVAKILGLSAAQRMSRSRKRCMTQGPGTPPYMPPEALVPNPRYDVKVDIFSYGVMMIHTLCGCWPFPGEAIQASSDNPHDLTPISEVGRRQEYLDNIPRDHPLMELIHRCLRNGPTHRPDASSVAEWVGEVASQSPPSFNNKVEMMDRIQVDAEQREGLQRDNETLAQERDAAISQQETVIGQVEELHQQVDKQGRRIESEVRIKNLLKERVEVLSRQKEAEVREKVAQSLEVEDLQLQVADLAAEVTQSRESIAALTQKAEANQRAMRLKDETLSQKDQAYQQALQQKNRAHQEALEQKDQMHKQSLQLKDERLAQIDHTYKLALQQKDEELTQQDRVHQQALQLKDEELAQKDQAHKHALQQKDQAHQQAMQLKDRAHAEAIADIERAHGEMIALKDQSLKTELQDTQTELTLLQQQLASSRDSASQKQKTVSGLRDQLKHCRSHLASNQQANLLTTPGAKLVWRECAKCPIAMSSAQAVVINGIVYVGGGSCDSDTECCTVCRYHPGEDKWATLPPSPVIFFGVGQVSGQLVLVGGVVVSTRKVTGDVHVFTSESQQWEKSIHVRPMPTARDALSVVSHSTVLVACGGRDHCSSILPTVELYKSEASMWYQCPPLPSPHRWMSAVAIGDILVLMGGLAKQKQDSTSKTVFSASFSTLIARATRYSTSNTQQLWITKAVPHYRSTAASIGGCLLALGGMDSPDGQTSASIHTYLPTSSTWHQTGELPLPLRQSTTALLPTNELLIIGGVNKNGRRPHQGYIGSVEV